MNARQSLVELFSTFLQFEHDRANGWVTDSTLRRRMLHCSQTGGQNCSQTAGKAGDSDSELFWVSYWYQSWRTHSGRLELGHLSAYLQEACYWVAYRSSNQMPGSQYKLPDCFQIAIATLPRLLQGYNPQGASLKTYASLHFNNVIRDTLRQQREANRRTDWGLLRKISQKQLVEALQMAGFAEDTIASYRLAWHCFKTGWAPSSALGAQHLSAPDSAAWAAIADLYNNQRRHHNLAVPAGTAALLEQWLKQNATRVRAYLTPTIASLNVPKAESGTGDFQDDLPDPNRELPLNELIRREEMQERQHQRSQLHQVLTAALDTLKPDRQILLELYYGQHLTQQQIAVQLNAKQYTISRRLSSAKETLLLTVATWSQKTLHISLTSTAVKDMSAVLEEWLQQHYQAALPDSSKDVP